MDIRAPEQQYNPYRIFSRDAVGASARRHADDAGAGRVRPAALAARPPRHEGSRGHLSAAVAPAVDLCRCDAAPVSARSASSSASASARCPTSSALPARSRSASRPRRACCRRCWRAGRRVPKVDLVTTDGFLYPNAVLERQGLMQKKGFPESYDLPLLLSFLSDIKSGRRRPRAGLFASDLRHRAEPVERDRPARHPDRRGRQRAADRAAAA